MAMRMAAAAAVALVAVMGVLAPRAAAQTPSTPSCAANLVGCAQYINTTGTPPDTCCGPLKQAIQNDLKCLRDLYASPEIFKAFNISLVAALCLFKRCGASDNPAACKGLSPTQSPPGSPSGGGGGSGRGCSADSWPADSTDSDCCWLILLSHIRCSSSQQQPSSSQPNAGHRTLSRFPRIDELVPSFVLCIGIKSSMLQWTTFFFL